MRLIALVLFVALPALAAPKAPAATTRAATAQEARSFAQYYAQSHPAAPAPQPVFDIRRGHGRRAWQVAATVDTAPLRATAPLCRMSRAVFRYDPAAAKSSRWSHDADDLHLVWVEPAAACTVPARPPRLWHALPDADVIALLEQQGALLNRARLLLAGNTSCAAMRALPFTLTGIDLDAPGGGKLEMPSLTFESDRSPMGMTAWFRKTSTGLMAWRVACGPPPVED